MPTMTTPALEIPTVQSDDLVHVVVAVGPVADFATYLGPKSCREAMVLDVRTDPAVIGVALLDGPPCVLPSNSPRFDGVSLPKIERGPSGRDVGTWHPIEMCG